MLTEFVITHNGIVERHKPTVAIELLQEFEPMALKFHPDGYYLAYSGGKDSDTALELLLQSGVKFSAHYSITGIDPVEALRHIKQTEARLADKGIRLYCEPPKRFTTGIYKGLYKNMWRLIVHKMFPPTRIQRYCCKDLKEHGGNDRFCVTGVRWDESTSRKNNRNSLEIYGAKKSKNILLGDNHEDRKQFETCIKKGRRIINPIVNWSEQNVWDFMRQSNTPYCNLYDEGVNRIGCIGCPMGSTKGQERDFKRYPHIKKIYLKAFDKMIECRKFRRLETKWKNGNEVMEWWVYGSDKEQQTVLENQIEMGVMM